MTPQQPTNPVPPPMPGEASATISPDEAIGETVAVAAGADVQPIEYASPTTSPGNDSLFRAGTLVYTSGGIALLFFWLLFGDFAFSMRDRSVGPTVQLFLRSLEASNFTMTMLMTFLPPAIGIVLSPMVSYRSDRLRSRWGRRIPYLLLPTPFAALAMVAIAYSPDLGAVLNGAVGGRMLPNTATMVVFGIAWTVFEVAVIISGAVMGGLINDVVPRGRLGRFYGLFRSVSLFDAILFNAFLLAFAETHFKLMFTLIAIVFGVGFMTMCFNIREGEYPPPDLGADDHRSGGFVAAVKIYFRECFSVPYYRWCFAAFTLGTMTFIPINTFSLYYAKQLNVNLTLYGRTAAAGYVVSFSTAYLLGWFVDRYHVLRIAMITMVLYAISTFFGMLLIRDAQTFVIALGAHTILSGAYFTAASSLMNSLLPRSKFAQFASAAGIVTSAATMIVGPSLGFVLDRTGSNYRLTFVAGLAISLTALAVMYHVYRQFMARGGPAGYIAPGDVVIAGGKTLVAAPAH